MTQITDIRLATTDDAETLWHWRNDELTRANSRTVDHVSWDDHVAWLSRRLERPEPSLYVAEENGTPVATVRIDGDEISYTVAPDRRGRGIATEVLKLVALRFGQKRAEIKKANIASIRAAAKAGHHVVLID